LLRQDIRPQSTRLGGRDRLLLDGRSDCSHHVELRIWPKRLRSGLHRDAQRAERSYSSIAGFFKQYELFYVVADERDLIRVRTNYRQPREDVYLYLAQVPRENVRRLFLDYVREINELKDHPALYNTLTTNCTTALLVHTR